MMVPKQNPNIPEQTIVGVDQDEILQNLQWSMQIYVPKLLFLQTENGLVYLPQNKEKEFFSSFLCSGTH